MAVAPVIPPRLSQPSTIGKKKAYPFMLGGMASACATFFTHPLDLTKVQMQTAKTNTKSTGQFFAGIIRTHGIRGAYDGLTAALLRALTYSTFRFGAYEVVKTKWLPKDPSMISMLGASAAAGGFAGLLGVPAEVVLIRMASDRTRPPAERYGYRNCIHGLYRITKDEGILALYRGVGPNVVRAVLMNSSQLASYDYFKRILLSIKGTQDGPVLQFGASFLAGTVATTVCAPADVVKSRVMASKGGSESIPHIIMKAVKTEGLPFFFRGWTAAWVRLCPQTILTLVFLEQLRLGVDILRGDKKL
ncbi:hypothetical protein NliqN6_0042 [Naganishia liquefaciens]|uniref:Mitochondrial carrier n=1 Tax=Naganishia liquefaciens TaxID=104408 RepID=A0A8H3TNL8_9TREE|nr:hypothetical protein NliqN6_0042 [Naganishia liquefaciens]